MKELLRTKIKGILRIACFFLVLGVVLGYVNMVLKLKNENIIGTYKFYELDNNSVDVLFIGSSHAYMDFDTGTLWDEYGIASYVFGGSGQPMWDSYYHLKEALKYQTPELIVLEGHTLALDVEYLGDAVIADNNFGLHWSANKVNAIKTGVPEESWIECLLGYTKYHTRYKEVSAYDFQNKNINVNDDWKGYFPQMLTISVEPTDVRGVTERADIHEKTEKYYRATIELAQANNIPIIVIVSPYVVSEDAQKLLNSGSDIAAEYGVPFLDCNLLRDEIGMDFSTDMIDSGHLNYKGAEKYSRFIGAYLKERYDIPYRKGDEAYDSWQRNAEQITQVSKNQDLRESINIYTIAEILQDPNYQLFITVDGNATVFDSIIPLFFEELAPPEYESCAMWYRDEDGWVWYSEEEEVEKYIQKDHDFYLRRTAGEDGTYTNEVVINNMQYKPVTDGVNIVVYDTFTREIADAIGINPTAEYPVTRKTDVFTGKPTGQQYIIW